MVGHHQLEEIGISVRQQLMNFLLLVVALFALLQQVSENGQRQAKYRDDVA